MSKSNNISVGELNCTVEELQKLLPEGYRLVETGSWVPKEEVEKLRSERDLDLALTRSGARNLTAARALLTCTGKETPEQIEAAVGQLKTENEWLFRGETTRSGGSPLFPRPTVDTDSMSDEEYYAYRAANQPNR